MSYSNTLQILTVTTCHLHEMIGALRTHLFHLIYHYCPSCTQLLRIFFERNLISKNASLFSTNIICEILPGGLNSIVLCYQYYPQLHMFWARYYWLQFYKRNDRNI